MTDAEKIRVLREALHAALVDMKHARVFIASRERMHSVGVEQYDGTLKSMHEALAATREPAPRDSSTPIDMLLWCPSCHAQHVDQSSGDWTNPPHKSHLCHECKTIWRPADIPTNGVAEIQTRGTNDTYSRAARDSSAPEETDNG